LLGRTGPIIKGSDANSLDIDIHGRENEHKTMAVLVFGGSRGLLKEDYSAANIEKVGRREFRKWSGGNSRMQRLEQCVEAVGRNAAN
jgi:hypothetical protein